MQGAMDQGEVVGKTPSHNVPWLCAFVSETHRAQLDQFTRIFVILLSSHYAQLNQFVHEHLL